MEISNLYVGSGIVYKNKKRLAYGNIRDFIDVVLFLAVICIKSFLFNQFIGIGCDWIILTISSLGIALLFAGFSIWFRQNTRVIILLCFDILLSVVMIADMVYFRYYDDVISVPVLRQVVLVSAVKNSILSLFRPYDLLFIIDILISVPLIVRLRRGQKAELSRFIKRAATAVVCILIASGLIFSGFALTAKAGGKTIFTYVFDRTFFVNRIGVINYHGFDLYKTAMEAMRGGNDLPDEEKNEIKAAFSSNIDVSGRKLSGTAEGLNLIVVQAEAFQNVLIDLKVGGKEVTPNLNKFVKRSAYFKNYFTQTGQGNTSDAEFLSNVSLYPISEGALYFRYATNKYESLPWLLKEKGYKTVAMHAYKGSYWNRSSIYPSLGFDEFVNMSNYKMDELVGLGLSDKSFFRQSIEKLKKIDGPFYAFMITLSGHYPYDAFGPNEEFDAGPYNNTFVGRYLMAQHYADQAFGELIDELEKSGLMNKSIIVMYGDHSGIQKDKVKDVRELFGLNGNEELGWLEMRKVPLIVHFPGDREAGTWTLNGGQVDLFPTLANLFDLKPGYALGKDLFNSEDGYAIFRDGSITDGKTYYSSSTGECYDITSGQKTDVNGFTDKIDLAGKQLGISDKIISHNLIKEFKK